MNFTTAQQRTYIDRVVKRQLDGKLSRVAAMYRIDCMLELNPALASYVPDAIKPMYAKCRQLNCSQQTIN